MMAGKDSNLRADAGYLSADISPALSNELISELIVVGWTIIERSLSILKKHQVGPTPSKEQGRTLRYPYLNRTGPTPSEEQARTPILRRVRPQGPVR